jgi:hypothetical protein
LLAQPTAETTTATTNSIVRILKFSSSMIPLKCSSLFYI